MANTLYIIYKDPGHISELKELLKDDDDNLILNHIKSNIRVLKFNSEAEALNVYANTRCTWSTLKPEDFDYAAFINEATEHIFKGDLNWLEENFT